MEHFFSLQHYTALQELLGFNTGRSQPLSDPYHFSAGSDAGASILIAPSQKGGGPLVRERAHSL